MKCNKHNAGQGLVMQNNSGLLEEYVLNHLAGKHANTLFEWEESTHIPQSSGCAPKAEPSSTQFCLLSRLSHVTVGSREM